MISQSSKKTSVSKIAGYITGKNFDGIDPAILKAAGDRGTEIHTDISAREFKTDEGKFALKYLGDFMPRTECRITPIEMEGIEVTGIFDAFIDETRELIDWKSEAMPDLKYWTVQLNLYGYAVGDVKKLTAVHLPKSGNYKVFDIPTLSKSQIETIIFCYRDEKELPADFWNFLMQESEAEEISLDLIVYNHDIGKIETNVDMIVNEIQEKLKSYVPENYSTENIGVAAKDRAALNKAEKDLNSRRMELEKRHNEPIKAITEKINSARDLIRKASGEIDKIVKTVEQKEKDEIKKELEDYFSSKEFLLVSFEKIFKTSWLNKTSKRKETKAEIDDVIKKIKLDIDLLDRINEPDAKVYYLETLDIDSAIKKADQIKQAREALQKEQEKKPEPVIEKNPEPVQEIKQEEKTITVDVIGEDAKQGEKILTRRLEIKGTERQLKALASYMDSVGICWEKI